MAILLANADGTVYHRYGGRTYRSPMNMDSLVEIMREGMKSHATYEKNPSPPKPDPPQYLPELVNVELKGIMKPGSGCFHCHYAREAQQLLTLKAGTWTPDQFWIFPLPKQIGFVVDQEKQYLAKEILPHSAASKADIRVGDRLQSLDGKRILTKYDIQWVLDRSDGGAVTLPFTLRRGGKRVTGELALAAGWKVGDPEDYSWRVNNPFTAHMIKFLPTPGFIGDRLSADELNELGLAEDRFALRVTKLNYGPHQAGIRLGDIILSAGGKSEFKTTQGFYAWCESMRRAGRDIKIEVRRKGDEMAMMVSLSYLNYSKVEKAPKVDLGFIPQQLPKDGGVRVGHVTDDSSAETAGLLIGDRIVAIDDVEVTTYDRLVTLIDQKAPGDLILIDVTRSGDPRQFSYILPGEEQTKSDVAKLDSRVTHTNQELTCTITIKLPPEKHIYSVHKKGLGLPTRVDFRGAAYDLVGTLSEPTPSEVRMPGAEATWVLHGTVELKQKFRVTDAEAFRMLIEVYAQVCDEKRCHEFRAVAETDSSKDYFWEYEGDFDGEPKLSAVRPNP